MPFLSNINNKRKEQLMEVKKITQSLLERGVKKEASDLYIFPKESSYEFSYRYHHVIESYKQVGSEDAEKIILYLKYQAGMDIAEKRKVQVGSATIRGKSKTFRIRLSSVGDYLNRETLVVRFLQSSDDNRESHYVLPHQYQSLKKLVNRKGLYLFSGPTGAGKSTTMYKLVKEICHQESKQVVTIEDPVEIEYSHFLQFQVNEKIDLTYESLIKVCLRHRPDILIIGEIRDQRTAKMVVRAALTGHTVFSTIHASDKESVLLRLEDFGVSKLELEQSLKGVIYQEILETQPNRKYGVLYDFSVNGVKTNWQESMEEAYKKNVISKRIYEQNY